MVDATAHSAHGCQNGVGARAGAPHGPRVQGIERFRGDGWSIAGEPATGRTTHGVTPTSGYARRTDSESSAASRPLRRAKSSASRVTRAMAPLVLMRPVSASVSMACQADLNCSCVIVCAFLGLDLGSLAAQGGLDQAGNVELGAKVARRGAKETAVTAHNGQAVQGQGHWVGRVQGSGVGRESGRARNDAVAQCSGAVRVAHDLEERRPRSGLKEKSTFSTPARLPAGRRPRWAGDVLCRSARHRSARRPGCRPRQTSSRRSARH